MSLSRRRADEPHLRGQARAQPRERAGHARASTSNCSLQAFVEHPPVESLVIVRRTAATIEDRPFHVLRAAGKHGRCELAPRVRRRSRIVADLPPAGDRAHDLLDEHRHAGLDRHADDSVPPGAAAATCAPAPAPNRRRARALPCRRRRRIDSACSGLSSDVTGTKLMRGSALYRARQSSITVSSSSAPTAAAGGESAIIASARNVPSPLP